MRRLDLSSRRKKSGAGFTLPSILVVVGALMILAVGVMLVATIERSTSRSYSDRQRAELIARSGLEDVRGILTKDAANDDYLVLQAPLLDPVTEDLEPTSNLFLTRGSVAGGSGYSYRSTPLFSSLMSPTDRNDLTVPDIESLVGDDDKKFVEFTTLPHNDKVRAAWLPVTDGKTADGRLVGRYAYWVEDLQSRVDASTAGNDEDTADGGKKHKRYGWTKDDTSEYARFPAPGLNPKPSEIGEDGRDKEPPLNQIALYTLDPASGAKDESSMDDDIIKARGVLMSPDSVLAAAGVVPPLSRSADLRLTDPKARALEESLVASVQPYEERPVVPFAKGINPDVAGDPKLNLNRMLAMTPATAVNEMADWIDEALPTFKDRAGGFPEDYLKTLAANAIDYADTDSDPTVDFGSYRGLDAFPLISEFILHIKYIGAANRSGRKVLAWQMIVYAELWNHSNLPVNGSARISYENKMRPPAIGAGVMGDTFDDPAILGDPLQANHNLTMIGGRYWSAPFSVSLKPNEYRFFKATTVNYTMDVGPASTTLQNQFEIYEDAGASGFGMMWNEKEMDRSYKVVRGNLDPNDPALEYRVSTPKQSGVANIPGHSYGFYNQVNNYKNNMGDSRQALYLRGDDQYPLSDNSYPANVSPNRRNVRYFTIYRSDLPNKPSVYGRVLPSEWPDGGHDADVPDWDHSATLDNYDPSNRTKWPIIDNTREGDSPTYISNRGRFYSATELGRLFDPVMWLPTFDDTNATNSIRTGKMPAGRISWPSVETSSDASIYYGGGNTLRIGRPEHPRFDQPLNHLPLDMPGDHAARLLDIFHAGKSRSEDASDREGPTVRIEGHINVNTATKDALRAMAGGLLVSDPRLVKRTSDDHNMGTMTPTISSSLLEVSSPKKEKEADVIADAIIRGRPYTSPSEVVCAVNENAKAVFGNRELLPDGNRTQWSDAAAEEAFARVYESSTVRSRNFRVWVIGQALAPTTADNDDPEVLGEVRKAYTVFADPGERASDGTIDPLKFRIKVLNENDF